MKNKLRFIRSESGQVLVFVIAFAVLAALIITPILVSTFSGHRTTEIRIARAQELYAADKGVEWALYQIIGNNTLWVPQVDEETKGPFWLYGMNGCDVDITIEKTDIDSYIVRSSGKKFEMAGEEKEYTTRASVEVHVTRGNETVPGPWIEGPGTPQPPGDPPTYPFSYAIASLGDEASFNGAPGGTIIGDIYIDGDMLLTSGTLLMPDPVTGIGGNAYADGDIVLSQGSRIMGSANANGNIIMTQPSQIDGYAYADGYISMDNSARIGGDANAQAYIDLGKNSAQIDGNAYANTNLIVGTGTIIHQDGIANDSITVDGGAIYGTAFYMNSLTIINGGTVGDDVQMGSTVSIPMPLVPNIADPPDPAAGYYGNASSTGCTKGEANKNYTISGTQSLGPCVVLGNLVMNNNASLQLTGTLYVMGTIDIRNNCSLTRAEGELTTPACLVANGDINIVNNNVLNPDDKMPLIMSVYGDITCKNNGSVMAALYAPNGTVTVENNTLVDGAIVGQNIVTKNNYTVKYNPAVMQIPGLPGGGTYEPPTPTSTPAPTYYPGPPGLSFKGVRVDSYVVLE